MATQAGLLPQAEIPGDLELTLRRMNPWWSGQPLQQLPPHRRHLVGQIQRRIEQRLAPIVVVRGARQIGKTTSQLQVLEELLAGGIPPDHILRVQCDELPTLASLREPILRLVDWFERAVLGSTLNEAAQRGERTFLFFDEVQNLKDWAPQLKSLVDHSTTQVLVTGSSALRIEHGRDSLAGRITTINAGVLSLTEIAAIRGIPLGAPYLADNGLAPLATIEFWKDLSAYGRARTAPRDEAFAHFSERGGYPLVHNRANVEWSFLADQLNENVIQRVIQHDLRVGDRGRKRDAALLEEVFRLACRYAGQAPALQRLVQEIHGTLHANIGPQRVRHYLRFLADTLLLRVVEPLEIRLRRRRGNPKICLVDHGLRASWLQEQVPLDPVRLDAEPALASVAGHIAESVVGATLATIHQLDLSYAPERPGEPEVDFVLTIGTRRIPIEVKYQGTVDPRRDITGLCAFLDRSVNSAPFGVLVTRRDVEPVSDARIVALPLSTLLLLR